MDYHHTKGVSYQGCECIWCEITHSNFSRRVEFRVAASGMAWKADGNTGSTAMMKSEDVRWTQWLRVARNFQLRVGLKDRRRETFDGFVREVCY